MKTNGKGKDIPECGGGYRREDVKKLKTFDKFARSLSPGTQRI